MTINDPRGVGWFDRAPGVERHFRRLADQLRGLEILIEFCPGAAVLDLGCAEGLIGFWLLGSGAVHVDGIEVVPERVERAERLAAELPAGKSARFHRCWLEGFATEPPESLRPAYEIVLLLSIAQKLPNPRAFVTAAARRCSKVIAVRQPDPVISDRRSNFEPCDVPALLACEGFRLLGEERRLPNDRGEQEEWLGLFERC